MIKNYSIKLSSKPQERYNLKFHKLYEAGHYPAKKYLLVKKNAFLPRVIKRTKRDKNIISTVLISW